MLAALLGQSPVLFVWSPEDKLFPLAHAQRYAAQLTDSRVALVDDAYSFTPEDQPERLAQAIAQFAAIASSSDGGIKRQTT